MVKMNQYGQDTKRLMAMLKDIEKGKTTELNLVNCKHISHLPNPLPDQITTIYCYGTMLHKIEYLPKNLITFVADGCSFLTEIPNELPSKLQELCISNTKIKKLPTLPESLVVLDVYCSELSELPELPDGLKYIGVSNTKIKMIKKLPKYLKSLTCNNNSITTLPELPYGTQKIDFENSNVEFPPEIPETIDFAESYFPSHIRPKQGETVKDYNERMAKVRAKKKCEVIMQEFLAKLAAPVFIEKIMKTGGAELFMDIFRPEVIW